MLVLVTLVLCLFFISNWSSREDRRLQVVVDNNNNNNSSLVDLPRALTTMIHWREFRWSGGGVRGATEGEENMNLDTKIHRTTVEFFEKSFGIPAASFESLQKLNYTRHKHSTFVKFFTSNVTLNTNPDCADRLHPSYQLLCHVWAAQQHHRSSSSTSSSSSTTRNSTDSSSSYSSLFKRNALNSMCSLFLACSEWKRGRYNVPLSSTLLRSTFDEILNDHELLNASQVLLRNLIHGGNNWHEYNWLADRVNTSRGLLESRKSPQESMDVRTAFQGGEITTKKVFANGTVSLLFSSRGNGARGPHLTRPLSALETIAVLHHRATSGMPQMVVFPERAERVVSPGDFVECRVPAINVLLFSGDSLANQMFMRLLNLVRRGPQGRVLVPYGSELLKSNFRHWPMHDRCRSLDLILAFYPTHDEFLTFQSLMPYGVLVNDQFVRSNESVTAYFAAVAKRRATSFCNQSKPASGASLEEHDDTGVALFYLVFLADAITSRPRTDALAPCLPAQPIPEKFPPDGPNYQKMKNAVSRGLTLVHDPPVPSLRSLGVRIPMHVVNSNMWEVHESSTTYEWLMRMATGNCSVTANATNVTAVAPLLPREKTADWRFGEHPSSDVTHLYRTSTNLWFPDRAVGRRRHALKAPIKPSRRAKPFSVLSPTEPRELVRLETPFRWLHDAVTAATGSDPLQQSIQNSNQNTEGKHDHRNGVFFSRLRVLDMGKVFLATGNVFHQKDGLHERCSGLHWLVGAASYHDTSRALRTSAERLTREVFQISPEPTDHSEIERVPLRFDNTDDCHGFGTLLTLNALLLDIVQAANES